MTGEEGREVHQSNCIFRAEEFVEKYKDKASVIGHFGFGFILHLWLPIKLKYFQIVF